MKLTYYRTLKMWIGIIGMSSIFLFAGCDRGGIDTISEKAVPLEKGMPHTILLPNGNLIYDISGEWDAIYEYGIFRKIKNIVKFTQTGSKFVGIKIIGSEWIPKDTETIMGELAGTGFLSIQGLSPQAYEGLNFGTSEGWLTSKGLIYKKGKKMIVEVPLKTENDILIIKLSRK